jgi:hypothetical protein
MARRVLDPRWRITAWIGFSVLAYGTEVDFCEEQGFKRVQRAWWLAGTGGTGLTNGPDRPAGTASGTHDWIAQHWRSLASGD